MTGETEDKHLQNLEQVLSRLEEQDSSYNTKNALSCSLLLNIWAHRISAVGLHPTAEKVCAIVDALVPKDMTQLRSFLGLVNMASFLPQLCSTLAPLYALLQRKPDGLEEQLMGNSLRRPKVS